nr:hypothetical protein [Tanacetum cinerariifolium]
RDSVSPPPLVAKPKKGKSQIVAPTLPKSQGLEVSGAIFIKKTKPNSKRPPTETRNHHLSQQKVLSRLPSTLNEGTRKSQPLLESTVTPPKDSEGNDQPLNRDLTFTTSNRGTAKTTSRLKGSRRDKDLGETNHLLIWNHYTPLMLISQGLVLNVRAILLSEDEAQESNEEVLAAGDDRDEDPQDDKEVRNPSPKQDHLALYLRKMSKTDKLMETSLSSLDRSKTTIGDLYKGLNVITQPLKEISNTVKDDPAINQKINEATETFVRSLPTSLRMSGVELSQTALKWEISSLRQDTFEIKSMLTKMITVDGIDEIRIANLSSSVSPLSVKNKGKEEQIKKDEEEARINAISKTEVIKVVHEEPKKLGIHPKEAISTKADKLFKKSHDAEHEQTKTRTYHRHQDSSKNQVGGYNSLQSTNSRNFDVHKPFLFRAFGISELDELRMSGVELSQTALKWEISSLRQDTFEIKSMLTKMYAAFQGRPSSAPLGSVTPTIALGDIQTEEPRLAILISSIPSTVILPTQPITLIIIYLEISQATLKIDKGKGIATKSDDDPSKNLVKASSIFRPDLDEPVRVELILNERIVYLTKQEIQDY